MEERAIVESIASESISFDGIWEIIKGVFEREDEQPVKAAELISGYIELKKESIKRMNNRIEKKKEKRLYLREDMEYAKVLEKQMNEAERALDMIKKKYGV